MIQPLSGAESTMNIKPLKMRHKSGDFLSLLKAASENLTDDGDTAQSEEVVENAASNGVSGDAQSSGALSLNPTASVAGQSSLAGKHKYTFSDPVTGQEVIYLDVARSAANSSSDRINGYAAADHIGNADAQRSGMASVSGNAGSPVIAQSSDENKAGSNDANTSAASGSPVAAYDPKKITSVDSAKTTKYDAYFKEAALKYDVSESLLKGIARAESNFNAGAVSHSGAMGVMQLMPATAASYGVRSPYNARESILGGAHVISDKLKEFNGSVSLALAAYNAGSGTVKRVGGVPSACRAYVDKVMNYASEYETA
ncbi:MAG: lytic transglycosylase domain-containing protein [Lachnospiraceae bacterium]|jgi:soluble lytic murein transglycosylase-like protein|nr:lytic transglycosylase domain-containing protein [Lachnospiraceae bacterium]